MSKVCEIDARPKEQNALGPLHRLLPANEDIRLRAVAETTLQLYRARHAADNDLTTSYNQSNLQVFMERADYARWKLDEIGNVPETNVFLATTLLHDRWGKRG